MLNLEGAKSTHCGSIDRGQEALFEVISSMRPQYPHLPLSMSPVWLLPRWYSPVLHGLHAQCPPGTLPVEYTGLRRVLGGVAVGESCVQNSWHVCHQQILTFFDGKIHYKTATVSCKTHGTVISFFFSLLK
jgi:hypothetical protein